MAGDDLPLHDLLCEMKVEELAWLRFELQWRGVLETFDVIYSRLD
jgi:hypothetical protein